MDASSGLVLALQFVVVSCHSLGASKLVSKQTEVEKTLLVGRVLGPCPCAIWSNWLVAVYEYHLDAWSRSLEHVLAQASYRLVAVLRRGSAEGHERSSLGGVYLSERSLLGSFRNGGGLWASSKTEDWWPRSRWEME